MKQLLVFTNSFPFGKGEQFLETESLYWTEFFDRVTLIPATLGGVQRDLPPGVLVDTSFSQFRAGLWRKLPHALFRAMLYFPREAVDNRLKPVMPRGFFRYLRFWREAMITREWLWQNLGTQDARQPTPKATVIYTYWLSGRTLGAEFFGKRTGAKVVSRVHGSDLYEEVHQPPYLPMRVAVLRGADKIFAVSKYGADYLRGKFVRGRFDELGSKITIARLGVSDRGALTAPSTDGKLRIVSVSSLIPLKRIHLIIEGLRTLANERPDVVIEWHHFGDGPLRPVLEKLASSLPRSIQPHSHGLVPNASLFEFYRDNPVDVFVNVSVSEGVPVSIMEAQSCGIPVIATAVGGTPEIVSDDNGVLLDPNPTPSQIAHAILRVKESSASRNMREQSRKTWCQVCEANRNYRDFCASLAALIE